MASDFSDMRPAMDCGELTRSAEALLDGEFEGREESEARAHLASCERCRRAVEELRRTRLAIREKLRAAMGPGAPHGAAPAALRARISSALDRERRPWWRRALSPLPIAAAAACAAGALLVLYTHDTIGPLADESVRRHARGLPLEFTGASVGADFAGGWFKGKVDFNARPPEMRQAGATLIGGRISHIKDHPAAYVRYELPRGNLGLFIVEDHDRRYGGGGREVQLGDSTIHMVNMRGYNVAVWRKDEVVYSLVSDLDERDLERIVQVTLAVNH